MRASQGQVGCGVQGMLGEEEIEVWMQKPGSLCSILDFTAH